MNRTTLIKKRKELGISQDQLADMLGIKRITVLRWESGSTKLPPYIARLIQSIEQELKPAKRPQKIKQDHLSDRPLNLTQAQLDILAGKRDVTPLRLTHPPTSDT